MERLCGVCFINRYFLQPNTAGKARHIHRSAVSYAASILTLPSASIILKRWQQAAGRPSGVSHSKSFFLKFRKNICSACCHFSHIKLSQNFSLFKDAPDIKAVKFTNATLLLPAGALHGACADWVAEQLNSNLCLNIRCNCLNKKSTIP